MSVNLNDIKDWMEIVIPGSDLAVRLHRLHADPETGAAVSLVRFPPNWRRPGVGHYATAEEFVLLEGSLEVGETFNAGDYVYLPPRTLRTDSVSVGGALVVAWFPGPPAWQPNPPAVAAPGDPVVSRSSGVLRADAPEVLGRYEVLGAPIDPQPFGIDVLDPETREWEWVPAGASSTQQGSRLHVRSWA